MDLRHALHHKNPQERAFIAKKRPDPSVMHACYASASESMLIFPWSTSKWCKNKSADFTLPSFLPSCLLSAAVGPPKDVAAKTVPGKKTIPIHIISVCGSHASRPARLDRLRLEWRAHSRVVHRVRVRISVNAQQYLDSFLGKKTKMPISNC